VEEGDRRSKYQGRVTFILFGSRGRSRDLSDRPRGATGDNDNLVGDAAYPAFTAWDIP
jgi:hypothetical protein